MAKDPVCGMEVGEGSEYKMEHKGEMYYFCCSTCMEQFKEDPEKYLE
ncbi:MAG: YHS domain-containing protein [Candidatus Bathyarchaeia archaeon]